MAKTFEVEIKFEDREKGPGTVAGKAIVTAGTDGGGNRKRRARDSR